MALNNAMFCLENEQATLVFGQHLGQLSNCRGVIFLHGDLGAGKTTLSRGILRGLGHTGAVKSPTFTLMEPYNLSAGQLYHFDLYRLADPEELEYMGFRDYLDGQSLCLIEWPEQGRGMLPGADLEIFMILDGTGRRARLLAHSERAQGWCTDLQHTSNCGELLCD